MKSYKVCTYLVLFGLYVSCLYIGISQYLQGDPYALKIFIVPLVACTLLFIVKSIQYCRNRKSYTPLETQSGIHMDFSNV